MSNEEKILHHIQGLFYFTISLAGIFLNLYLFKLGGFQTIVKFGITSLAVLFILYIFSGWLLKKYSSKTLMISGLVILTTFYSLVFLLQEKSINFLIPLGVISGIGNGLFWPGNNLTTYISTHEHSRNEFFGKLNFFINFGAGLGAILGGGIIQIAGLINTKETGYEIIFLLVSGLMALTAFITLKLPNHKGVNFSLSHIFAHKRSRSWKIVLFQQFLYGCIDVAFSNFSAVLIFLIVKEEFFLGAINTISTIVFALSSIVAGKILQKNPQKYLLSLVSPLGLFIFAFQQNWIGILSLVFINNIFMPFLGIATAKSFYDVVDKSKESWENKYHFLIERDSILGFGRILNYLILLFFITPSNQLSVAKNWAIVVPIIPLIIIFLQTIQYKEKTGLGSSSNTK